MVVFQHLSLVSFFYTLIYILIASYRMTGFSYRQSPLHKIPFIFNVLQGIYRTASLILKEINENHLLEREFKKPEFKNCSLVLAGHSLGAGVVSVLSVILKRDYPNLTCYAFSPPGSIFRSVI